MKAQLTQTGLQSSTLHLFNQSISRNVPNFKEQRGAPTSIMGEVNASF